jgi:indolepyruvate ferredoxin oxidoreductase
MALPAVTLDDKYVLERGRIYLTGTQALVRLPLIQRRRDLAAGLNTGGFVSGYRGSPLGGLDQGLWQAKTHLEDHHVTFQPGVNEELAATAVWGTQQVNLYPTARYDGVFAMWYGKGPGVDRAGDVFKHANGAGTSRHGGVLLLAGDDSAAKSSTFPHQSEHALVAAMVPVLSPAGVQEILDYGLIGWAMSRYSGCWIGMKIVAETADSSASVHADMDRVDVRLPTDFEMPPGGLNIRWPDPPLQVEERLMKHKLYAALAFARANRIDGPVLTAPRPRFGIVTTGKAYLDVRQALDDLGITDAMAADLGVSIYKVGMPWPLEPQGIRAFAEGLEEILVVEEKRALIENQMKEQFYNWPEGRRPRVSGKFDESALREAASEREQVLPSYGELSPSRVAIVLGRHLIRTLDVPSWLADRVRYLEALEGQKAHKAGAERVPWFCSGCPHNTSTVVPEGSRALAGIGCHYMVVWMDRKTETFTQMGGEGVPWIGQAPFMEEKHVFANLGDGTYYHSGFLAIRQAIAAKANITYKILFNDAVAMTGGQKVDGELTVPMIAQELVAEGVRRVVVVSDEPEKYGAASGLPSGTAVRHRDDLDEVQRSLRETRGVSIMIYDQTCASEKRRRRKRGTMADPAKRVVVNERVCEGCGDCSVQSNCLSVAPVETEFGRKRQIDQSTCNKDFSCVKGFCPSFVTVEGGQLKKPATVRKGAGPMPVFADLPDPVLPPLDRPWSLIVTGVGGTGVVTVGALIGMAAHLEGKGCSTLDQTGLAQKGGAVMSHVRVAATPEDIHAVRIAAGGASAVIGCDLVVAGGGDALSKMDPGRTRAVLNADAAHTAAMMKDPNARIPVAAMVQAVADRCGGADRIVTVDATRLSVALLGDSIATNVFMLGLAWQRGLVPLSAEALERAIELNGTAVAMNRQAFLWGRRAACDPAGVEAAVRALKGGEDGEAAAEPAHRVLSRSLDEIVERRVAFLTDYQDAAWAARYRDLVRRAREAEERQGRGLTGLAEAVARNAFKLMAYKDEYEVARLYTDGTFAKSVADRFEGDYRLTFHLAPPAIAHKDPRTGHLKKRTFGPWMMAAFRILAKGKRLRGTRFDPFGRTEERGMERRLIAEYEATVEELIARLSPATHALAVSIAQVPDMIRGFGHVKEANVAKAEVLKAELLEAMRDPAAPRAAAE